MRLPDPTGEPHETPLQSWKEIAAYLGRDVRTAQRWEQAEGLPVRRHRSDSRGSVYAYPSELNAWRAARKPRAEEARSAAPVWKRALPAFGGALALIFAAWVIARGPILNPPSPLAEAADAGGIVLRQVWAGPEVNTYGAPSPDGKLLSYTDWSTPSLAIRNLASGETRRLIDGSWKEPAEFPFSSRFSPDGRQIISLWHNKEEFAELRVVSVDGGPARVLFRQEEVPYPYPAEWSPDGKSILATFGRKDGTAQIALVAVEDGSAKVLKTLDWRWPGRMTFSPDGRYIAYDFQPHEEAAERDIFVLASDGSREAALIQHPADDRLLGWSPDGDRVLFGSDRTGTMGAWIVEVTEGKPKGQPRFLKPDIGRIAPMGITNKGSFYYALTSGIRDLYVATREPTTGKILQAPQPASERFVGLKRGPEWSPDGENLAYSVRHNDGRDSIFIHSLKTGRDRELIGRLRTNQNVRPRWSPDGRWLLVNSRHEKGRRALYRVDAQTGAATRVLPGVLFWAVWSADGKSIIYVHPTSDDKGGTVRMRRLESGDEKELFRPDQSTYPNNLALSPDGRSLAFGLSTISPIIGQVLMVMAVDGGRPRELYRASEGQFAGLEWARDGKHILYALQGQIWRISVEGGQPQPLGIKTHTGSVTVAIHPDGRRIAFTAGDPSEEVWVMENFLPRPGPGQ